MCSANSNSFSAATLSRRWMRRISLPSAMWLSVLWQKQANILKIPTHSICSQNYPRFGGRNLLRKVDTFLPEYTASHSRIFILGSVVVYVSRTIFLVFHCVEELYTIATFQRISCLLLQFGNITPKRLREEYWPPEKPKTSCFALFYRSLALLVFILATYFSTVLARRVSRLH